MKHLILSFFILISSMSSSMATDIKVLPIPGLCMSISKFQAEVKSKKMHLIFFSTEEKTKNVFMVFSNVARQGFATMYIKDVNLACIVSIFEDGEGLVNWNALKPSIDG